MSEAVESIYGADVPVTSLGALVDAGDAELQTGPFGTMLHASAYADSGVPVVAVKHISDNTLSHDDLPRIEDLDAERLARYRLRIGDILFARKGSVERRALVRADEADWIQGSDCIRLRLMPSAVDPRFASYVLGTRAYRDWILRHAHGATMPSLNQEILRLVPMPLLALAEQHRIAAILGGLDAKIDLNRRMNRILESMVRAIFRSWFIDFDPVRLKMEGKTGGELGLPSSVAALVPDDLEESAVGLIPKGWPVVSLSSLVEVNPKSSLARGSQVPYVEMSGLPTDAARITDWRVREFTSGSRFRNGDVLVARITPCLENGKTALVDFLRDGTTGWGSTEFLVLRPRDSVPTEYVYCLSRSEAFRDHAVGSMNGSSGRQRVPAEALERLSVVRPPEELLRAFGTVSHSAITAMAGNDSENEALTDLRNSLLPKLLSGELAAPSIGQLPRRGV